MPGRVFRADLERFGALVFEEDWAGFGQADGTTMTHGRRSIAIDERRARLARRHHLAHEARAAAPLEVAQDLVGLHSTDPSSVYLAAFARLRDPDPAAVERALYEDRSLVRMLAMRRTMWVVPAADVPIVHAAASFDVGLNERRRLVAFLEQAGVADDAAAWLTDVEDATLDALRRRGSATGQELARDEPRLRTQVVYAEGKSYGGPANITTRVLSLLALEGRIVRGKPLGSWTSSQYRWQPMESWLAGGVGDVPPDVARAQLARRWLAAFGPATLADLRWWTGWTAAAAKRALAMVDGGLVDVDLNGREALLLADDAAAEAVPPPEPWVALLPALDPTVMGWVEREWYLGPHSAALFDGSGNAGPTIWADGRVVGGWAQRPDGSIACRLLEDVGRETALAIEETADRLSRAIGEVRITPRFRTPIERELSG